MKRTKKNAEPKKDGKITANVTRGGDVVATFYGDRAVEWAETFIKSADKGYSLDTHDRAKRITVFIEHDEFCRAPDMDCDGQWKLYSFSRRHDHYGSPDRFGLTGEWDETGSVEFEKDDERQLTEQAKAFKAKLDKGLAFFLSYYEHGQCSWELNHTPQRKRGAEFDRVSVAGLLVWEEGEDNLGAKTVDERAKDAEQFLETFTAWCNGECYEYCAKDEDGEELEDVMCSGFYGNDLDYMFDRIREELPEGAEVTFAGDSADLAEYHDKPTKEKLTAKAKKGVKA
jgi:hypothetical protein